MIAFDHDLCSDLTRGPKREWLETNGIGGYSSSTIVGINTRRYHGLLVAALPPLLQRVVLLSKLEETLIIGDQKFELSANQYPGTIHPQGFQYLQSFRLDPYPIFTYAIDGFEMEKSVFMLYGENTTIVQYTVTSVVDRPVTLEVRPLLAFRDYHSLLREGHPINSQFSNCGHCATVQLNPSLPSLYLAFDAEQLETTGYWYRSFEYERERERGLDSVEDLFNPFVLTTNLGDWHQSNLIASTEKHDIASVEGLRFREVTPRQAISRVPAIGQPEVQPLVRAADQFLITRDDSTSVVAGYHWFAEWGRDAMISLPGLTLSTGRFDDARDLLLTYLRHADQGLLPNRFSEHAELIEYNTVDASLWAFQAACALVRYSGDDAFLRDQLYGPLTDIAMWYLNGTRYGIRAGEDGLLEAGEPGVQLTWMDAKVGDWVVTPRSGKPVEIQALWYNALRILETFARRLGDREAEERWAALAQWCYQSFNAQFWNSAQHCLFDCVDGEARDESIRPNQIFAVSLPFPIVSTDRAALIVELVTRELLTPYGLRTLSPSDPRYCGRYQGDVQHRDAAYHQGTVWAWLIGPYITAYLKTHGNTAESRQFARRLLGPLLDHLSDAGVGSISEIFDGDPPHEPRGCIAQAWSVAEVLRCLCEDVYALKHTGRAVVGHASV